MDCKSAAAKTAVAATVPTPLGMDEEDRLHRKAADLESAKEQKS